LVVSTALVTANPPPNNGLRRNYDYVIIGAGASGLTVANRLTENPKTTVLVIEAGDFDNNEDIVTIPGLAGGAIGTKYDWNLTYVASDALLGRNVSLAQGKVVGGSTKLNRMVFDRGSKSDYNRWATLGNVGWDWASLLPYFKKVRHVSSGRWRRSADDRRTRFSHRQPRRLLRNTMSHTSQLITVSEATCTRPTPHSSGPPLVCTSLVWSPEYTNSCHREHCRCDQRAPHTDFKGPS